jgi:hypothetical protein
MALSARQHTPVYVDQSGKLRWSDGNGEAYFWGVNYTLPFAHAYRQTARNGFSHKQVIDADAYHLSRMGVNAFRIHVWDCEISDGDGNLLDNEHLNLLDYVIYRFEQRGIHILLTPIAYWGNGYPEPNEPLPGFSQKYTKGNVYTEPAAIAAQERYLKQFVHHVNPYTGKKYKDDPMIIAFEVCNEPGHSKAKETTLFVKKMCAAIRSSGCDKPVFYNVTQSIGLLEDFIKGGTDGVTFQWYPTGLVAGFEREGNFLPHVDAYDMPFRNEPYFAGQAKIVYEFDAADIGRSYLYPPIALSFKEAGMHWVTQFAYDPYAIAASNTEYQTHFLNLVYAPQKALGFKIAGELFRNPQYQKRQPAKGVTISYRDDLSELATDRLFYHTNHTRTQPENLQTLQSIAGYGSSPVVSYNGRGAYFLDKTDEGEWRLEVFPDAVWVRDPFSRATPRIKNVLIQYCEYPMEIRLPDLGGNFFVTGVNEGNRYRGQAENGRFAVTPGTYLLSVKPFVDERRQVKTGVVAMNEFFAPAGDTDIPTYVLHQPQETVVEGQPVQVTVDVVTPHPVRQAVVQLTGVSRGGWRMPVQLLMHPQDRYRYTVQIPDSLIQRGILRYVLKVDFLSGRELIYPGAVEGTDMQWTYYNPDAYQTRVLPAKSEILLLSAEKTERCIFFSPVRGFRSQTLYSMIPGETALQMSAPVPANDRSGVIFAMESFIAREIAAVASRTDEYPQLVIRAGSGKDPVRMEVSLIGKDGDAYGATVTLADDKPQVIALQDLKPVKMLLLPRPYPGFLPFWYEHPQPKAFRLDDIERIQLIVHKNENTPTPEITLRNISLRHSAE